VGGPVGKGPLPRGQEIWKDQAHQIYMLNAKKFTAHPFRVKGPEGDFILLCSINSEQGKPTGRAQGSRDTSFFGEKEELLPPESGLNRTTSRTGQK